MKKMALVIKDNSEEELAVAKETAELLSSFDCSMYLPESARRYLGDIKGTIYRDENSFMDDAECVIVFGGDGTIMRTAHKTRLPEDTLAILKARSIEMKTVLWMMRNVL